MLKMLIMTLFFFSVSNYRAVTIGIKSLEQRDNLSKRSLQLWSMPLHNLNLACIMMCDYLSTDWIYHYLNLRIPNCDESQSFSSFYYYAAFLVVTNFCDLSPLSFLILLPHREGRWGSKWIHIKRKT